MILTMKNSLRFVLTSLTVAVLVACSSAQSRREESVSALQKQAPFQLGCKSNEKVQVTEIEQDQTYGVRGCGKRATYTRICKTWDQCHFIINGQVIEEK